MKQVLIFVTLVFNAIAWLSGLILMVTGEVNVAAAGVVTTSVMATLSLTAAVAAVTGPGD